MMFYSGKEPAALGAPP